MSFDTDPNEVKEAVERCDSKWLWSAIEVAYLERDQAIADLKQLRDARDCTSREATVYQDQLTEARAKYNRALEGECSLSGQPGIYECTVHDGAKGCLGCQMRKARATIETLKKELAEWVPIK